MLDIVNPCDCDSQMLQELVKWQMLYHIAKVVITSVQFECKFRCVKQNFTPHVWQMVFANISI